ncbi:SDR family NAD(P)-dependent oxidoreductase [Nocardiopsis aegyptia]|uniref:NAD(P)-dependent dehydrogenase (Short-subunit alcohol dehydrogenase family) n=1 Tax=Nocardiopsis aegyptia TaxID=220378 RepID=A0A7Z0EJA8_9ACTN|nr:SDR family oxidoreductase [Nocardiopsis aegyptia]NYJ33128.1 NAD(P)-dependent dehydrogenase (short-subunit alcohol dehydrogenase family) [Nocardiopsis aegyptia]
MIRWTLPAALAAGRWALSRRRRRRRRARPVELVPWAVAGAAAGVSASVLAEHRRATLLRGRAVLVTGGSRGLGLRLAREFGSYGASVAVCGRDRDRLDRAVAGLAGRGIRAHGIQCDLADPEQARAMVEEAAERLGGLDVVVNNAGVLRVGPRATMTTADLEEAMAVMFWGPYHVARAAWERLRESQGSLVTITSIGGHLAPPHLWPYACAKAAQVALSEGLAAESLGTGVRVTTVVPGLMRTGSHRAVLFSGAPEREYAWFALCAGLPLLSMSADRAARRVVRATVRGHGYVVLTPAARLGMAAHGLAPGLTQRVSALAGWLLPAVPPEPEERPGTEAAVQGVPGQVLDALTALNEDAARRLNQPARAGSAPPGGGASEPDPGRSA